ncbi:MAG: OmpA family protein [Gammaproteobacteria bacterium]|nr:OmpA family protein [Gammaproteobacteria bacterium]
MKTNTQRDLTAHRSLPKLLGTAAILAAFALTTGCEGTGGTREDDKNAVTIGAALAGMLAANALGVDNNLGKVAVGALAGYTARQVFNEVNQETAADPNTDVEAVTIGGKEYVQVSVKNVNFRSGSAELDPYELSRLTPIINTMAKHPNTRVHIEGHTDSDGSKKYNQQLSENRAKSVAFYLMDNGISRDRIQTYGYGEERPIASNTTPEGKRENRRVTFLISEI